MITDKYEISYIVCFGIMLSITIELIEELISRYNSREIKLVAEKQKNR